MTPTTCVDPIVRLQQSFRTFRLSVIAILLVLVSTAVYPVNPTLASAHPHQENKESRSLEPGIKIDRDMTGGEAHNYGITIVGNHYLHLVVVQKGIDVIVNLFGPGGTKLVERDSPNGRQGPEKILIVAEEPGRYRVEVRSPEKEPAGRYEIKIEDLRTATNEDRSRVIADRLFLEAVLLFGQGKAPALREAIQKYEESLPLWRAAGDRLSEARTFNHAGNAHSLLGAYQKAIEYFNQALTLSQAVGDRREEAIATSNLGTAYYQLGQYPNALSYFQKAQLVLGAVGDSLQEAIMLNNIGTVYLLTGEPHKGLEQFQKAIPLARAANNQHIEANTLHNIGGAYLRLSEYQKALDQLSQVLLLRRTLRDSRGEAVTLLVTGDVYGDLGDYQSALHFYQQSLPLMRTIGNKSGEATALNNIGFGNAMQGEQKSAVEFYDQALIIRRAIGDRAGEAKTLINIGAAHATLGDPTRALDSYRQALSLEQAIGNRDGEALVLHNIGAAHERLGEHRKAVDHFDRALAILREVKNRRLEANSLYRIAEAQSELGNLEEARTRIEEALKIVEAVRLKAPGPELRTSYLASAQTRYELYIDLLMRLHKQRPSDALEATAFETSERARARTLSDTLAEAKVDIRYGVDPSVLERERSLQQLLNSRAERQIRMLSRKHTEAQAAEAASEMERITTEYRQVQAQMRAASPRYAALTQPEPLSLKEIQQQVLDANSLLLEYALGEKRSYLWAVTQTSITGYELPGRDAIEAAARRFYDLVKGNAKDEELGESAARLSEMVLAPAVGQLGNKRLVIVADGALQYVPFGALARPGQKAVSPQSAQGNPQSGYRPLIVDHEIVSLPSASTLAVLRRETRDRALAPGIVAVLADPVFDAEDVRVRRAMSDAKDRAKDSREQAKETGLLRSVEETGLTGLNWPLPRLLGTRREARTILSLSPTKKSSQSLDFEASREAAVAGDLSQYQIVHFATHGLINNRHPELSGLVLSLVDKQGLPQDGFLRLNDIYNLRLPAELVVLSACQTGVGKEIRGEGLVGLTRGFMYAGARRMMASLWQVDDAATSELMGHFYRGMLGAKKLTAAAALRAAQIEMWKQKDWRAPSYWAAFVLQGEWR